MGNLKPEAMSGIEKRKLTIDIFKHTTTLSTGAIVVLATFLSQDIASLSGKLHLVLSLIGFLLTILCAFFAILVLVGNIQDMVKIHGSPTHNFLRLATFGLVTCFSAGIIFLIIFMISNFP